MLLFSRSVMSESLRPKGLHHARLPCPSPTLRACSNSCPLSQWCHPTIWSSVFLFSLQSFPASDSFPMSRLFASGGQSIGASASASVPPMNIQVGGSKQGSPGLLRCLSPLSPPEREPRSRLPHPKRGTPESRLYLYIPHWKELSPHFP